MRGMGLFFGRTTRNGNYKLDDPHPVDYRATDHTGNPGLDGYTLLSRADPDRSGCPPNVAGTVGQCYRGPDDSFEQ